MILLSPFFQDRSNLLILLCLAAIHESELLLSISLKNVWCKNLVVITTLTIILTATYYRQHSNDMIANIYIYSYLIRNQLKIDTQINNQLKLTDLFLSILMDTAIQPALKKYFFNIALRIKIVGETGITTDVKRLKKNCYYELIILQNIPQIFGIHFSYLICAQSHPHISVQQDFFFWGGGGRQA